MRQTTLLAGIFATGLALLLIGCEAGTSGVRSEQAAAELPACDPGNGGIQLPDGFCAVVVTDSLSMSGGQARHLAVADNGDLYVALRRSREGGGIAALRDTTGDGRADRIERFGDYDGTGIELRDGYLYFAPDTAVVRYRMTGDLVPAGPPETVVDDLYEQGSHAAKPFAFDEEGWMYVNVGAPSNACQEQDRTPGSRAQDPCPLLEQSGGIWQVRADELNQTQDGHAQRFATGIRNAVAIAWNPGTDGLYVVQHGRDMLHQLFPELYTEEQGAELPAEELFRVEEGADFGWPYCYYDHEHGEKVLAPEYGGDSETVGRCAEARDPLVAFPGHYAPNDLLFYTGDLFPERFRGGAFIAFHGSWNRAPLPQEGYQVAFVPFSGGAPSGDWEVFADGFKGAETIESPGDAAFRPMGLAQGPDGSLYITDSQQGRIWRVVYTGDAP